MDSPENLDWVSILRVDSKWIIDLLLSHSKAHNPELSKKLVVRAYSLKFAGTEEHLHGLVKYMADSITNFVYSDLDLKEIKNPWKKARDYFGNVDPLRDGKSGELLLYLLVEAVLKIPLIAHKIRYVGDNPNDQAKGSDGIFMGNYNDHTAFLFGEAKIHNERSVGIN